ncbi:tryptophan synthase subunit beta like protein [Halomonas cupida]|uniref:tryptophan synthase subunit beta like protein n=1 Tax=Halomonas cupida TaxID=44933 RepID=UPI003A92BD6E
MYVQRDADERILSVSRMPTAECTEQVAADDSELLLFLSEVREDDERARLQQSDLDFVRVLEDVLDLLMDKGVISFTDLPEAARRKIMQRQSLRRRYNDVDLVGDDEPLI